VEGEEGSAPLPASWRVGLSLPRRLFIYFWDQFFPTRACPAGGPPSPCFGGPCFGRKDKEL
jgi:hypothetical protein